MRTLPGKDQITGKPFFVSELTTEGGEVTVRGKFALPRFAHLDEEQAHFLEAFLRCRGMISSVEKELGMSYPTVRARLDALLVSLDLAPVKETMKDHRRLDSDAKARILDQLESGEIDAAEAKNQLNLEKNHAG